jgi:hypothetical protein
MRLPFYLILYDNGFDFGAVTSIKAWQHPNQIQKRAYSDNSKSSN